MNDERRLDAYYYGFDATGVEVVDKILGAVACAGKAFHHTCDWTDKANFSYDDHTGDTTIDWVQNAANEAADEIATQQARIVELEEQVAELKEENKLTRSLINDTSPYRRITELECENIVKKRRIDDLEKELLASRGRPR